MESTYSVLTLIQKLYARCRGFPRREAERRLLAGFEELSDQIDYELGGSTPEPQSDLELSAEEELLLMIEAQADQRSKMRSDRERNPITAAL